MKKIISLLCATALVMTGVISVSANSTTTSIGIGGNHTGIVTEDGQLMMTGYNEYGEYGNGTKAYSTTAFTESVKDVVAVACGYSNSTAVLKKDNTMWVSGSNNCGQLGNGTFKDSLEFILVDTDVVKIGAGEGYFIYLKKDGTLWGMGDPGDRKLLIKRDDYVTTPIKIMSGIRDFSTYYRNTAVINTKDELYMFGANVNGQLGIGNTTDAYDLDLPVKVLDNVRSVSCGTDYVLAVKNDNTLYSWGRNDYSQLMNGHFSYEKDYVPVYFPTKVAENVLKACAGDDDSGYITTDHKLYMTGHSLYGQAGFDPLGDTITKPRLIAENVADVAIHEHTVYTTLDGNTYTAGHNINGSGDYYDGFMERPYTVAPEYDFSNLLDIKPETVKKAKQPMTVKATDVKVSYKKLKKSKQTVKVLVVKKAQGTVSYAKISKGSSSKLTVDKKTGKVTVKKGTKKGTYKINIKITAKGNSKYFAGTKTVSAKIKVK